MRCTLLQQLQDDPKISVDLNEGPTNHSLTEQLPDPKNISLDLQGHLGPNLLAPTNISQGQEIANTTLKHLVEKTKNLLDTIISSTKPPSLDPTINTVQDGEVKGAMNLQDTTISPADPPSLDPTIHTVQDGQASWIWITLTLLLVSSVYF